VGLGENAEQTTNEDLKVFILTIQRALQGSELKQLGNELNEWYRQAWQDIITGIEGDSSE